MSIRKAYQLWMKKKENSDFNRIKINSSGSFSMASCDLFNDKAEVKKYTKKLGDSLNNYKKHQPQKVSNASS